MDADILARRRAQWQAQRERERASRAAAAPDLPRKASPAEACAPPLAAPSGSPAARSLAPSPKIKLKRRGADSVPTAAVRHELEGFGDVSETNFTLVSWNLDGLTEKQLVARTLFFIDQIRTRKPAIIMLQEVISVSHRLIKQYLSGPYVICEPAADSTADVTAEGEILARSTAASATASEPPPYYNLLLLSKYHWECLEPSLTHYFGSSQMGRHLVLQRVRAKGLTAGNDTYLFGSTHLESLKPSAAERKKQTELIAKVLSQNIKTGVKDGVDVAIIGGDCNARDAEVNPILTKYPAVQDVWEMLGRPAEARWTWDTTRNDNLESNIKAKCRFDRIYMTANDKTVCFPTKIALLGTTRMGTEDECNMFCSDHWGLGVQFDCLL